MATSEAATANMPTARVAFLGAMPISTRRIAAAGNTGCLPAKSWTISRLAMAPASVRQMSKYVLCRLNLPPSISVVESLIPMTTTATRTSGIAARLRGNCGDTKRIASVAAITMPPNGRAPGILTGAGVRRKGLAQKIARSRLSSSDSPWHRQRVVEEAPDGFRLRWCIGLFGDPGIEARIQFWIEPQAHRGPDARLRPTNLPIFVIRY
jgi:hypothetical protein